MNIDLIPALPASNVFRVCNEFKMVRPHACSGSTEMIPLKACGGLANQEMMSASHPAIKPKHPISISVDEGMKKPTRFSLSDLGPKALRRRGTPTDSSWIQSNCWITVAQKAAMMHSTISVSIGCFRGATNNQAGHINVQSISRSGSNG